MIGRPFVRRAVMHLPASKTFTIVAKPMSDAHPYIGKAFLNDKPLDRTYFRYQDITASGGLCFVMQAKPNKTWSIAADARPYSMSTVQ